MAKKKKQKKRRAPAAKKALSRASSGNRVKAKRKKKTKAKTRRSKKTGDLVSGLFVIHSPDGILKANSAAFSKGESAEAYQVFHEEETAEVRRREIIEQRLAADFPGDMALRKPEELESAAAMYRIEVVPMKEFFATHYEIRAGGDEEDPAPVLERTIKWRGSETPLKAAVKAVKDGLASNIAASKAALKEFEMKAKAARRDHLAVVKEAGARLAKFVKVSKSYG